MPTFDQLLEPLHYLPPVHFAFAYGSNVFSQKEDAVSNSPPAQTDYILGVDDALEWHRLNLQKNPSHYAPMIAALGPRMVTAIAERVGVGVHFNTHVPWRGQLIKYGVISRAYLEEDVEGWENVYVAGRLHKPVKVLKDDIEICNKNKVNLKYTVAASLLQLPGSFSEVELYRKICGISYLGDIRMAFSEDPKKVEKIVAGSFHEIRRLYRPTIAHFMENFKLAAAGVSSKNDFSQDTEASTRREMFALLPRALTASLVPGVNPSLAERDACREWANIVVSRGELVWQNLLKKSIARIVRRSSLRQAISGFLVTGGYNSLKYVSRKIGKGIASRFSN